MKRPTIDLTALPDTIAAAEYWFRVRRAEMNPTLAVQVVFRVSRCAKFLIEEQDTWAIAV